MNIMFKEIRIERLEVIERIKKCYLCVQKKNKLIEHGNFFKDIPSTESVLQYEQLNNLAVEKKIKYLQEMLNPKQLSMSEIRSYVENIYYAAEKSKTNYSSMSNHIIDSAFGVEDRGLFFV